MASLLTKRRTMPRAVRKVLWIIGGVVVGLFALSYVVGLFAQARAVHEAQKLTTLGPPLFPNKYATCHDAVTPACTNEAARRNQMPVAWLPVPSGYRLKWVMATGAKVDRNRRFAEEVVTGDRVDLSLSTQPPGPWQPGNEQLVGTYTENGDVVRAYRDRPQSGAMKFSAITYRWMHDGIQYQLWVSPHYMLDTRPIDAGTYASLLANVRYAQPPTHPRSGH